MGLSQTPPHSTEKCQEIRNKFTLYKHLSWERGRWLRRKMLNPPPPMDTLSSSHGHIKAATMYGTTHSENLNSSRTAIPQLKIYRKSHTEKGRRGRDRWEPNPRHSDPQVGGYHRCGGPSWGARSSSPTADSPCPGDLHWEDEAPYCLALKISGA